MYDSGAFENFKKINTLNSGSVGTSLGEFFYLWFENKNSDTILVFLSNEGGSLLEYTIILKNKYRNLNLFDRNSPVIDRNIRDFAGGKSKRINIGFCFLTGTGFDKDIWQAVSGIEFGKVRSYKEVAELAGYPLAWRAAGTATGKNPLMLVVPCHRVIKSSGEIGQYGGGEEMKKKLLNLEAGNVKPAN
jgi:methylated-DNA-[protein]-cysteine S-methyltransferase